MKVELYSHQQKAVDELSNGKILRGDPGVGKSFTALAYFYTKECGGVLNDWGSLRNPKDIYIITTAKKRNDGDWQRDARYLGLMEDREISVSGIRVVVDSWNNIEKYVGVENAFFIFDESKVVGSGPWAKSFLKLAKTNRWIILSATPGDTWMDYVAVFLANGFYKNRTEFVKTHVVYATWVKFPKVDRYVNVGRLVRNRNAILVEMHYERHTTRHLEWLTVGHDADLLEEVTRKRWHVYEERPLRDIAEMFAVARKVVNSNASRLTQLRKIQAKHKRVIVFYNFDYELEILRTLAGLPEAHTTSSDMSERSQIEPLAQMPSDTSEAGSTSTSSSPTTSDLLRTESPSSSMSCPVGNSTLSATDRPSGTSCSMDGIDRGSGEESQNFKSSGTSTSPTKPSVAVTTGPNGPQKSSFADMETRIRTAASPTHHPILTNRPIDGNSSLGDTTRLAAEPNPLTSSVPNSHVHHPEAMPLRWEMESSSGGHTSAVKPPSRKSSSKKPSGSVHIAEWNGHKHQPVPTTKEWIYLVQYMAGSEAWNCITTDAMVFYSQTYSYKQFEQSQGRIDRINTPFDDLWYYVLFSDSWIDKAIKSSLDTKQNFNEARVRHQMEAANRDIEKIVEMMADVE